MKTAAISMEGTKTCAVPKCTIPVLYPNNLCDGHRLPGMVVEHIASESTYVITVWYAEHGDEVGLIHLNDFALGDLFGGRQGFEAQLAKQGFIGVRNISTPEEIDAGPPPGKKVGDWFGPWLPRYPWEMN